MSESLNIQFRMISKLYFKQIGVGRGANWDSAENRPMVRDSTVKSSRFNWKECICEEMVYKCT